ncbi:cytochrome bc complex cytochrome b subunit [Agromyces sp. NPDC056523]|uniref:cytochrome bc1 complex cytochrome b subunit n=1 Tax=Agromyces sp. NPDC056523 TaxID=3345850 RepID=UPI00366DDE3E
MRTAPPDARTPRAEPAAPPPAPGRPRGQSLTDRLADRVDTATVFGRRLRDIRAELHRRTAPTHWTNLFGIVTLACLVVLTVTGIWLMFFYTPSSAPTTYEGGYSPLHGAEVSKAFASTMRITFEVPGGLLMRQAHHWAALLLPASIIMQLLTTFFTGGFRRPRRGMWVLLFGIYVAALAGGWSGYALPDDMLSGTGLRITEGIALGIPVVGTWIASLLFGGSFPGEVIEHLYPLHVAVVPVALVVLLVLRAIAAWHTGPARFPGSGVGVPLVPTAAARAGGLFALVTGVLLLISATVTINPIWLYGPADSGNAGAGSQPDWYTGFLDGALRLVPSGWEFVAFDRTWTLAVLAPLAVVTVFLVAVAAYPFFEEWATGDRRDHHLLERTRLAPTRTGIGVAGIVFFGVLWAAGSADLIATQFSVTFEGMIAALQVLLVAGPALGFLVARRVCLGLQRRDRDILHHGYETGRIVRLPGGEYIEVHRPVGEIERARMARPEPRVVLMLRPDERGRLTLARQVQARLARWYLADSIDSETGARMVPVGRSVDGRA